MMVWYGSLWAPLLLAVLNYCDRMLTHISITITSTGQNSTDLSTSTKSVRRGVSLFTLVASLLQLHPSHFRPWAAFLPTTSNQQLLFGHRWIGCMQIFRCASELGFVSHGGTEITELLAQDWMGRLKANIRLMLTPA